MATDKTLEERLEITERKLTNGKSALLVIDPNNEVEGVIYQGKKLVSPDRLAELVKEKYALQEELEFNKELLSMHNYFDSLRDSIKKKNKNVDEIIEDALHFLADEIGAFYVGFHINPQLKDEGKIDAKYANYQCTEMIHAKKGFTPLNGAGKTFYERFRSTNPDFIIDHAKHNNLYFEDMEQNVEQIDEKRQVKGSGFTLYLQPGHDVIGAIQALQTKKIGNKEAHFIEEWVKLADTFLSDMLDIKIEAENNEMFSEEERIAKTFSNNGISFDDLGKDFVGAGDLNNKTESIEQKIENKKLWQFYKEGSFFDKEYSIVRDGITAFCSGFKSVGIDNANLSVEDIHKKQYEKGIKLVKDIYREKPEFGISKEDAEKDLNSAISCMKIMQALYYKYGDKISKGFKLSDKRDVDKETLETASIFSAGFARAIKYMHQADKLPRIAEVRDRNDIREMTSYLANLIEIPELSGELVYHGESLVNKQKKASLLGSTVIEISDKIDPNKESHFAIDLIEKVMAYEEMVQETTSTHAIPIEKALWKMYEECIKQNKDGSLEVDAKGITAIRMIDYLVNPEGKDVYKTFEPQLKSIK